jgi:hypothetical protein
MKFEKPDAKRRARVLGIFIGLPPFEDDRIASGKCFNADIILESNLGYGFIR